MILKALKYFPLMQLLLIYLIVNSLLINADDLNKPLEVEHGNPRVKNIIVGSFVGGALCYYYYLVIIIILKNIYILI